MKKQQWSSQLAFVISSIASAVGVGNIWRFSYIVGENGGGTFILPYIILVFLIGVPVLLLEFIAGNSIRKTALAAFRSINKKFFPLAYIPISLNIIIGSYYIVITGWTLFYFLSSLGLFFMPFSQFSSSYLSLVFSALVAIILYAINHLEIKKGLEKVNIYSMQLFAASILILFINAVLTLNFDAALKFYLTVDWGKVLDPTIITAAASQIIFSLGVGYGIMLTYASYSRQDHKIFQSAIVVALADSIVALTAGLTIFSTVFSFGLNPQAGPLLAFEALPLAFFNMPFGGALLSIFFLLLFIAAITSAVSIIELLITNIEDTFNSDRKSASLYAALFLFLISIPSALSYAVPHLAIGGVPFLDFMDGVVTEKFAPLAVFITVVYIGYLYKDLEKVARKEIPTFYLPIFFIAVRYIVPLFLLAISLTQFFHN